MSDELPECLRPKPVDPRTQRLLAALKKATIEDSRNKEIKNVNECNPNGGQNMGWGAPLIAKDDKVDFRYAEVFRKEFIENTGPSSSEGQTGSPAPVQKVLPIVEERKSNAERGDDEDDEVEERRISNQRRGLDFFVDKTDTTNEILTDIEGVSTIAAVPEPREFGHEKNVDVSEIINKYFSQGHHTNKVHQRLPIMDYRTWISGAIKSYNVIIIQGNTGCGKTTKVPQFIMEDALLSQRQPVNIFCTQPRKIAARSVAQRVCDENGWELGSLVGYQVGLDSKHRSEDTMLTYCTTGVLLERIIAEKSLKNYSHIIVDEVHERDVDTDLLLMLIRWYMKIEPITFCLIIMSATMDIDKLLKYFEFKLAYGHKNSNQSISIQVTQPGSFTNSIFYLESLPTYDEGNTLGSQPDFDIEAPELLEYCVNAAALLINKVFTKLDPREKNPQAVLVFLPGRGEINELDKQLRRNSAELDIRLLHSNLPSEEQNRVFEPAISGKRKVILSTNIAESSITLADIGYVIDFCLSKANIKDQRTRFPMLQLQWASKDRCVQRAGRAGRVIPGKVFRLIPEGFFKFLHAFAEPEVLSAPLEQSVLRTKKSSIAPPVKQLGLMVDPPRLRDIRAAIIELKQIGALTVKMNGKVDREDGHITELGNVICNLPIDVHLSKLIVMGYIFDCLDDCIIVAACMSGRGIIRSSYADELGDFRKRISWSTGAFSDLFVYLEAYKEYTTHRNKSKPWLRNWCENERLDLKKLQEVDLLNEDLRVRLERLNIFVEDQPNRKRELDQDELMLKFTFCASFYPNFYVSKPIDSDLVTRMFHDSDPTRSVYLECIPKEQGPIYKNQIVREFEASISNDLDILFTGSRAVVVFNDVGAPLNIADEEKEFIGRKPRGFVSESVYLALKLGMTHGISIREFNTIEAHKRIEYYDNKWKDKKAASNTITSTRIKLVDSNQSMKPKKYNWIPTNINSIYLRVMNIVECCHFFARLHDPRVSQYEDDLYDNIKDTSFEPATPDTLQQLIGEVAFARHPKDLGSTRPGPRSVLEGFHRIEVRSKPNDKGRVQVFFYDFGLTCMISENDVHVITEDFERTHNRHERICSTPVLAFECKIHGIKPATWATTWGGWSDNAQVDFRNKVLSSELDRRFEAKVFSHCDNIVRLDIFGPSIKDSKCESTSLRQRLITMGEGVAIEESEVSMRDHKVRQDHIIYPVDAPNHNIGAFCEIERDVAFDDNDRLELRRLELLSRVNGRNLGRRRYLESADKKSTDDPSSLFKATYTQLKGPLSPISLTFQGLSTKSSKMAIAIERDSINSVSVDADYLDKRYQLLIAGTVTISANGRLMARDTTLMPKIHGLPSIISLLFAPYYEFRVNPYLGCLSGALFGLGFDKDGMAIDSDNDIEIDFDCLVTKSDVDDINMCRRAMTELISKLHIQNSNEPKGHMQQGVRNSIMNLIRKRRLPIKEYLQKTMGTWEKFNAASQDVSNEPVSRRYLPPIHTPDLDDDEIYRRLRRNISRMDGLIERREKLTIDGVMCLLCDSGQGIRYVSLIELRYHLESDKHTSRVQEFELFEQFRARTLKN